MQAKKTIFKEPILSFQRNVFFPRKDEEKIKFVGQLGSKITIYTILFLKGPKNY